MTEELIESLPPRPLTRPDAAALGNADAIDWCAVPTTDSDNDGYVALIVTETKAHALGFNDKTEQWVKVATVDRKESRGGPLQLENELHEWANEVYDNSHAYVPDLALDKVS